MTNESLKKIELFAKEKIKLDYIYNIDCLEFMKKIPDNSIDLIFADPPS